MKQMLALILCVVMLVAMLPVYAAAEEMDVEFEELVADSELALGVADNEVYESEDNNVQRDADVVGNDDTVYGIADGRDYDMDWYTFTLEEESSVEILLVSRSSMMLVDLEGNGVDVSAEELGQTDGRKYAYLIEATLAPGTYYITVIDINACMSGSRVAYVFYLEWEASQTHTHSYTADQTVEPTCVSQGYTVMRCGCGDYYYTDYTDATGVHVYSGDLDPDCDVCGQEREVDDSTVPMFRMYDPNSGEHFYTGAEAERDFLVEAGWHYEGVGFNFPREGAPVYRMYEPVHGEHLYTMDEAEKSQLLEWGWSYEGVAFNSAGTDAVPQYRLHNPNAKRGGYHFTGSPEERDLLISLGWIDQGIGWYSCLE